jgi:hypothetical protein
MATTVGQHGVAAFVNPSNGDTLDADIVKGNDNTMRSAYVDHDSDPGIHVQSSLLAARPSAGTEGRKWVTTDGGDIRFWYDDGSVWQEVGYLRDVGNITTGGSVTVSGGLTVVGGGSVFGNLTVSGTISGTVSTSASNITSGTFPGSSYNFAANVLNPTGTFGSSSMYATASWDVNDGIKAYYRSSPTYGERVSLFFATKDGAFTANRITQDITGTVTIDLNRANCWRFRLTGNATLSFATSTSDGFGPNEGPQPGATYIIEVLQDGTGSRTIGWSGAIRWPGGVTPTQTSTANRKDIYQLFYDGTNLLAMRLAADYDSTG